MAGMRRVPQRVLARLQEIDTPSVVVACGKCVSVADLTAGMLAMLAVTYDGTVNLPANPAVPPDSIGPISSENASGREVVHRDEPKIRKDVYLGERPIYGDWSNGSFSLWQPREVYRRSSIPPRGLRIRVEEHGLVEKANCWRLTFTVQPPLVREDASFDDDLLFALNLLRENVGCFDVHGSNVDPRAIVAARQLTWDIFPPGERDLLDELSRRMTSPDPATRERILNRGQVIIDLKPAQFIVGTGFNSDYYGALFADNLVVFENLEYGNATYVLYEDWEQLSQLSRSELLASDADYDRLVHGSSWQERLTELVKRELRKRRRRW